MRQSLLPMRVPFATKVMWVDNNFKSLQCKLVLLWIMSDSFYVFGSLLKNFHELKKTTHNLAMFCQTQIPNDSTHREVAAEKIDGFLPRLWICCSLVKPYQTVNSGDESLLWDTGMSAPLLLLLLTSCVALGKLLHHLFLHPPLCREWLQAILQSDGNQLPPCPDPKWHDQDDVVPSLR